MVNSPSISAKTIEPFTALSERSTTATSPGNRRPGHALAADPHGEGRGRVLHQQLVEIERPVEIVVGGDGMPQAAVEVISGTVSGVRF